MHIGWVGALAAGGLTWAAATYVVNISGANREVTEGVSSVFAAVVLLGVGLWMHQKSAAGRWQAYLREKMSGAMNRRSAYAMAGLAFVAVYREVFETVLFFSALWTEGNGAALLLGLAAGAAILAGIAWLLLRTSARMPIGKFFSASSDSGRRARRRADRQGRQGASGSGHLQRPSDCLSSHRIPGRVSDDRAAAGATRCREHRSARLLDECAQQCSPPKVRGDGLISAERTRLRGVQPRDAGMRP